MLKELTKIIEKQQKGRENSPAWMVGEQLKEIAAREPGTVDILLSDLKVSSMSLVEAEAAMIVRNDETETRLLPTVFDLLTDDEKQNKMRDNIVAFAKPNAAEDIVDQIELILNKK